MSPSTPPELWPTWLPEEFPELAAWSVGHDASPTIWRGSSLPLAVSAENVFARILAQPELTTGNIVFVGHSLGGLIIKAVLRCAEREAMRRMDVRRFLNRIRRVAFLGTPHQGSGIVGITRMVRILGLQSVATGGLGRNNDYLRDLNNWYKSYSSANNIENLTLYETQPIRILGIKMPNFIFKIVEVDSADPGVNETAIPINANHKEISKPKDRESEVYILVRDFVTKPFPPLSLKKIILDTIELNIANGIGYDPPIEEARVAVIAKSIVDLFSPNTDLLPQIGQPTVLGSTIIDVEAKERLFIILKSRFYSSYDTKSQTLRLLSSVETGDLSGASPEVKAEILGWCGRLLATTDPTRAEDAIKKGQQEGENLSIKIGEAFLEAGRGKLESALAILASIPSSTARSAAFIIFNNANGASQAFNWLEKAQIPVCELDPDGKFIVLQLFLQEERWTEALAVTETCSESDFDQTPALIHAVADAHLVQVVPDELKSKAMAQSIFEVVKLPLAADTASMEHRRIAQDLYERSGEEAKRLGFKQLSALEADRNLWLRLNDATFKNAAKKELIDGLQAPETLLRQLPLALEFGIELDLSAVEREIDRQTALTGGSSPNAAIARLSLASTLENPGQVAAYLESHRVQLTTHLDPIGIGCMETEMLARAGNFEQAMAKLEVLISEGLPKIKELRLRDIISAASTADPLYPSMALYEKSDSLIDLRNLVKELESKEDWEKWNHYSKLLFERTHDLHDAVSYVRSLYKTERNLILTNFIIDNPAFLTQSETIKELHCWSLYKIGNFSEALKELQQLRTLADKPNYRDLTIMLAITSGDWESLQTFVEEEWSTRDVRSPQDLLRTTMIAHHIESPRSRELVAETARRGSDDPKILLGCYMVATESGREDLEDAGHWLQMAASLSDESGPVQRISLQDIVTRQPHWITHAENAFKMLNEGTAPMFVVAHLVNRSAISMYILSALSNQSESDVRRRTSIPAFSGARLHMTNTPRTLSIDPSALLTCELLGITSTVLEHFPTIAIPHNTLDWLFEEKRQVQFHQPSRIAQAHEIRALISAGSLRIFDPNPLKASELAIKVGEDLAAMIIRADQGRQDGFAANFVAHPYPVHTIDSLMKIEADLGGYESCMISCLPIVVRLREAGQLTTASEQTALAYLALQEQSWPGNLRIEETSTVYLDDVAVSHLQHLGLLSKLRGAGVTAYISSTLVDHSDSLIRHEKHTEAAISLIDNLRLKLRKGIETGVIRTGRRISSDPEAVGTRGPTHPSFGILELSEQTEATVIDDRFFNQHMNINLGASQRPLLSTIDLLSILNTINAITYTELLQLKTILRQAGMFHVPIDQNELETHLSGIKVNHNNNIMESAELKAIRENLLRVKMTDSLVIPNEFEWYSSLCIACFSTIQSLWTNGANEKSAGPASEWLFDLIDSRLWSHRLKVLSTDPSERYQAQVTMLMGLGIKMPEPSRTSYYTWLDSHFLDQLSGDNSRIFMNIKNHTIRLIDAALKNTLLTEANNEN